VEQFTLRCEVCGRKIHSDPIRAIIEGARLTVCVECSKHGKVILPAEEVEIVRKEALATGTYFKKSSTPVAMVGKKSVVPKVEITKEIVEDYQSKIRVAREKLGLSVEDLGLKINEKASVLKHVELGKMAPNNLLASKLERALKITLLVPIEQEKEKTPATLPKAAANEKLTLGDLMQFDKKEVPAKRKLS
jgi:putative transcription factor